MESKDLGFKIKIPNNSGIQELGGYDGVNSDTETAGFGIDTLSSRYGTDMVVVIEVGKNLFPNLTELLQSDITESERWGTEFTEIQIASIGNTNGYETYGNPTGRDGLSYEYVSSKDGGEYLKFQYFYPFHNNTELTGEEKILAEEILSTFELLE